MCIKGNLIFYYVAYNGFIFHGIMCFEHAYDRAVQLSHIFCYVLEKAFEFPFNFYTKYIAYSCNNSFLPFFSLKLNFFI